MCLIIRSGDVIVIGSPGAVHFPQVGEIDDFSGERVGIEVPYQDTRKGRVTKPWSNLRECIAFDKPERLDIAIMRA
jgi:hypothetical protein